MSRVKTAVTKRRAHKKVLKAMKGSRGAKSRTFRHAHENLLHALDYAYRDRRNKKRDFRRLWILKINAAARAHGFTYAQLMDGLKRAKIVLNRKSLASLAEHEPRHFAELVQRVREQTH